MKGAELFHADGQTDRRVVSSSSFSKFCEGAKQMEQLHALSHFTHNASAKVRFPAPNMVAYLSIAPTSRQAQYGFKSQPENPRILP
jgi:hypothetical protein